MSQCHPFQLQRHKTEEFVHLNVCDVVCITLVLVIAECVEFISNLHLVVW